MFGYGQLSAARTSRKKLPHTQGKMLYIFTIQSRPSFRLTCSSSSSRLTVSQTLPFCLFQSLLFHQQTLPLIAFSSTTPFQHNSRQSRVLTCAPSKCCVAGREKDEMVKVGACQAKCSLILGQRNPGPAAEIFSTLIAERIRG